ncbi:hypothetical protein [Cellulomonas persica]|uniref:Uncharacterized protein n=1 Tax=Cellulomonas persica TaxID=76861 RepID=A0A510UU32_9CELL|nr:hypothetical protein [Cellulomonas persica]GEK18194.1 hypothetical protein CPE01_19270 [Cellulomonas persica]
MTSVNRAPSSDGPAARELAGALDGAPAQAHADAGQLEGVATALEEVGATLRRLAGDLGIGGTSAQAARDGVASLAASVLGAADTADALGAAAARAAGALARARTDYETLPAGELTAAERQALIESGAGPGLSSIVAARAAERERVATTALATVGAAMDDASDRVRAVAPGDAGTARGAAPDEPRDGRPGGASPVPVVPGVPTPVTGPVPHPPIPHPPVPHPPVPHPPVPHPPVLRPPAPTGPEPVGAPPTFGMEPPAPVHRTEPVERPVPLDRLPPLAPGLSVVPPA